MTYGYFQSLLWAAWSVRICRRDTLDGGLQELQRSLDCERDLLLENHL